MVYIRIRRTKASVKTIFSMFAFILYFTFAFIFGSTYILTHRKFNINVSTIFSPNQNIFTTNNQYSTESFSFQYNFTHLWSMHLADQNYFRLARLLSCPKISYDSGPSPTYMDSCDHSLNNEFSLPNLVQAQKWIYDYQHPSNCSNKRFAIIHNFAPSGFGSTIHQIVWAFGTALGDNRIAVYETPGNWIYGDCSVRTPDCVFLPITNCSFPLEVDGKQTIRIRADLGHFSKLVHPPVFENRTFNWYRTQLVFYLMRFKPQLLAHVQHTIAQYFDPPSVDLQHPYIAVYVRRSDKVKSREMLRTYTLKEYFDLFDGDARRANISTVYVNSEDEQVFDEFEKLNKERQGYYKLLSVNTSRNIIYPKLAHMSSKQRGKVILEFLTDLFIEVNADLHAGTLTSNWCRLVDEMRLALGKILPYYTPENKLLMNA